MAEPKGHPCPECGTPRRTDNTPVCGCGRRAADALRDTRTAEAAAAEDFDPLRIRPYVALDTTAANATSTGAATDTGTGADTGAATNTPAAANTGTGANTGAGGATGATATSTSDSPGSPTPAAPPDGVPDTQPEQPPARASAQAPEPSTPEQAPGLPPHGAPGRAPDGARGDRPARAPRGRRRLLLLAAAGSVVAVAAATGYASGMFSYATPTRNAAMPSDLRASVPDGTDGASFPGGPASAGRTSPSPRPSLSASASPSASSSASASASPSHPPGSPSATATAAPATGSATPVPGGLRNDGVVLRRGDRGPEVAELQSRLHQLDLYRDDPDGHFTRPLENALRGYQWSRGVDTDPDELGVYGPDTRRSLEAETREP